MGGMVRSLHFSQILIGSSLTRPQSSFESALSLGRLDDTEHGGNHYQSGITLRARTRAVNSKGLKRHSLRSSRAPPHVDEERVTSCPHQCVYKSHRFQIIQPKSKYYLMTFTVYKEM